MSKTRHYEAGFSLVEAMVALALLAMVSTASVLIFSNFLASGDSQQRRMDALTNIMRARSLLTEDLAHAVKRPHGPTSEPAVFEGDDNKDCFLTFARRAAAIAQYDARKADIESVSYCLSDGRLVRRSFAYPDAAIDTKTREFILIADIANIDARFHDGTQWQNAWFIGHANGRYYGQHTNLPPLVELSWQNYVHVFRLPAEVN